MAMRVANVAEFRMHLSQYLAAAANGEEVKVRKRNAPHARVVPVRPRNRNRTVLGSGRGSVVIKGSLVEPLIPTAGGSRCRERNGRDSGGRLTAHSGHPRCAGQEQQVTGAPSVPAPVGRLVETDLSSWPASPDLTYHSQRAPSGSASHVSVFSA